MSAVFAGVLVVLTAIDIERRIVPNKIVLPVTAVVLVAQMVVHPDHRPEYVVATVGAGLFLLLPLLIYPAGMGLGDVKLAAMLGLYLGRAVAPAIFVALISGVLIGAVIIARYGSAEGRKKGIPFGPWLSFGGLVGLFAGDAMVDWYLDTFT